MENTTKTLISVALALAGPVSGFAAPATQPGVSAGTPYGLQFSCSPAQRIQLAEDMPAYLTSKGIGPLWTQTTTDVDAGTIRYSLLRSSERTLDLSAMPELAIQDEMVTLPLSSKKNRQVKTVSKKEIILALLNPGRLTRFSEEACSVQALVDHVGVRQNTVAWAEVLQWGWPEGGPAKWNKKFWKKGTPHSYQPLHSALIDMFYQQKKYEVGCYTATKVVYAHATLDYYVRVKKDRKTAQQIEERLLADGEPLVDVEPGKMWNFEKDYDAAEDTRPGKVLQMTEGVSPGNFIPGDWVYFLNTDARTYEKTGYEGSNAIYLGRNKFDDYYNDNQHSYTYQEKLDEVYQWRHDVFSRTRDFAKIEHLSPEALEKLSSTPKNGGLLQDYRVTPYIFGAGALPPMPVRTSP